MKQLLVLLLLIIPIITYSQSEEEIKEMRNAMRAEKAKYKEKKKEARRAMKALTNVNKELGYFHSIVLSKDLEVDLLPSNNTKIEIMVDADQLDYINYSVGEKDSILRISSTHTLKTRSKWAIRVFYKPNGFRSIKVDREGVLNMSGSIKTNAFNINLGNRAELKFAETAKLEAEKLNLTATENSRVEMRAKTKEFNLDLYDNSRALINCSTCNIEKGNFQVRKSSELNWDGESSASEIVVTLENSYGDIRNLAIDDITLNTFENSRAHVNSSTKFTLNSTGNSKTYLYGRPVEFDVQTFNQGSQLIRQD